jgi:hypothetical protein
MASLTGAAGNDILVGANGITLATLNNVTNASLSDLLVPHGSIV